MDGKIHVVTSITPGNGAKYLATNLAYDSRGKDKKNPVLLVDFDFLNPYLCYEFTKFDEFHGVDNIVSSITGEGLTEDLFKENIIHTEIGVDVLRGTRFADRHKEFMRTTIETIINFSRSLYQDVFIVVNSIANNAGTVYSLLAADSLIAVLKNDNANMARVERVMRSISQYYNGNKEIYMVYNFNNRYAKADVNSKLTGMNVEILGVLDYDERSIDNVNLSGRKSLFGTKDLNAKVFEKILEKIRK